MKRFVLALMLLAIAPASASPISREERQVANFVCYVMANNVQTPDKGKTVVLDFIQFQGKLSRADALKMFAYVTGRYCPVGSSAT